MSEVKLVSLNHFFGPTCNVGPQQLVSLSCCITTYLWIHQASLSLSAYLLHKQHHWIQDSISTPERSLCDTPLYTKVWPPSCSWKTHTNAEVNHMHTLSCRSLAWMVFLSCVEITVSKQHGLHMAWTAVMYSEAKKNKKVNCDRSNTSTKKLTIKLYFVILGRFFLWPLSRCSSSITRPLTSSPASCAALRPAAALVDPLENGPVLHLARHCLCDCVRTPVPAGRDKVRKAQESRV